MARKRFAAAAGMVIGAAVIVLAALAGAAGYPNPVEASSTELLAMAGLVLMTFRLHWGGRKMKRS